MKVKTPKKLYVKITSKGEGIKMKTQPDVLAVAGRVYEVPKWLYSNLINREAAVPVEAEDAIKILKDQPTQEEPEKELEDFTVPELKEIADQEAVNIEGLTKKAEIIAAIREATEEE